MANKRSLPLVLVLTLAFGFLLLAMPEKGYSQPEPVACCQWELEGQLACSTISQGVLCAIPIDAEFIGIFDNLECDEGTGQCVRATTNVPTLSEWGLIAMAGVLGVVGFMVIRRKRATA